MTLPNESKSKKPRQSQSKAKVTLIIFFGCRGVVHSELLPESQRSIKSIICVFWNVWEGRSVRNDLISGKTIHEFCTTATCHLIKRPLQSNFWPNTQQLSSIKHRIRQIWPFESVETTKQSSPKKLNAIPENAYKKCFDNSDLRWYKCIGSKGTYFEVDKINFDNNWKFACFI